MEERRQRTTKACDFCHLKRIKCIAGELEGSCRNCASREIQCTFLKPTSKRGPAVGSRKQKNRKIENHKEASVESLPTTIDNSFTETNNALTLMLLPHKVKVEATGQEALKNDFKLWNPSNFPMIKLSRGDSSWVEIYISYVHPKYPILPLEWTRRNWKSLPMFVLHILFAMTMADPFDKSESDARDLRLIHSVSHFQTAKQMYKKTSGVLSSMDAVGILFLGVYSLFYTEDHAAGVAYIHESIRIGHVLGIYRFSKVYWNAYDGSFCSLPSTFGSRFCQLFTFITYEMDLHTSNMTKKPYFLHSNQPAALFQPLFNDPSFEYSPFYNSYWWCWRSQITYIGRRITASIYGFDTPINDSLNLHVSALQSWYDSIPKWVLNDHQVYSSDVTCVSSSPWTPAPWIVICMLAYYHASKLRLLKGWFFQAIEEEQDQSKISTNHVVMECLDSAWRLDRISSKILKGNPNFIGISPFFYEFVFVAGSIHCASLLFKTDTASSDLTLQAIERSIAVLTFYSSFCPLAASRLAKLKSWRGSPKLILDTNNS